MSIQEFDLCGAEEKLARMQGLARAALAHWDLGDATISLLKHRENHIYKVTDERAGKDYVLRVHRPGYHEDDELRSEIRWMMSLRAGGVPTAPVILPARSEEPLVHVSTAEVPLVHQCDLLGWVDGRMIARIEDMSVMSPEDLARNYRQAGALSAAIHNHGERWERPVYFKRKRLDANGLMGANGFMGDYRECKLLTARDLVEIDAARALAGAALAEFGTTPDRFGLTHNDFLPENLLRDGDVLSIIDFDDGGFGWHMMDMATMLFFLVGEPQFDEARESFCAGYRTVRALPDEHVAMLPVFLFARCLSYLGWAASREDMPVIEEVGPALRARALEMGRELCTA